MESNASWIASFNNKQLELILLVTEQCNFRCVYCYEDFKLGKIESNVIEGVKNLISNRINEIQILTVSFFGGEPLLNKPAILEISKWASKICYIHNVQYFGGITTNGYSLDEKTFTSLIQSEVKSFQITLDGEKQIHDRLRPTLNGKSTFEKIYSNIAMMARTNYNFACSLRFNIADSNFDSVKYFINNYSMPFKNDRRFTFHFHPIFGMPQLKLTGENYLNELTDLAELNGFKYDSPSENHLCYAARADSFVIRADGRVQKCTVALESEINNIGKIHKDGTLEIDNEKLKKWILADDKSCPLHSLSLEKLVVPYEDAGKYVN